MKPSQVAMIAGASYIIGIAFLLALSLIFPIQPEPLFTKMMLAIGLFLFLGGLCFKVGKMSQKLKITNAVLVAGLVIAFVFSQAMPTGINALIMIILFAFGLGLIMLNIWGGSDVWK